MRLDTICPRQAKEATTREQIAHEARWLTNTWSWRAMWYDRMRDGLSRLRDWVNVHVAPIGRGRYYGGAYWPRGAPKPRVCSFCGSAHPDDAIALVKLGWEVHAPNDPRKRFLHPSGHRQYVERLWHDVMAEADGSPMEKAPEVRSPVPPVRIYTQHFSSGQIVAFNEALARQSPMLIAGEPRVQPSEEAKAE